MPGSAVAALIKSLAASFDWTVFPTDRKWSSDLAAAAEVSAMPGLSLSPLPPFSSLLALARATD